MNNLTTRKIVLGMLMTLVLALSVQGIADALTIELSGSPVDLSTVVDESTVTLTIAATANISGTKESVRLSANRTFFVGDSRVSSFAWTETDGDSDTAGFQDGSLTVPRTMEITITGRGEVTFKLTDTSSTSSANRAAEKVLTYYVVRLNQDIPANATIRLAGVTNGIGHGYYDQSAQRIYNGDGSHYPVTYIVTGAGLLYVKEGDRSTTPGATLNTSSGAQVYLEMTSTTNTVTASVDTSITSTVGIYIYGRPTIGADVSVGPFAPGTLLTGTTALTANIKDSTTSPSDVAGVPVMFEVADKRATGGTLFQASGTTIVDNRNMMVSSPTPGSIFYVRTDASGDAKVDFRVGTGGGEQVITAKALGLTKTIKVSTTVSATTRRLSIPTGGNQQRQGTNIFDLTALVENGGEPEQDVLVRFIATRGILTDTPSGRTTIDHDGDSETAALDDDTVETGKDVAEITDSDGLAKVIYNTGDSSTGAEVVASISVIEGGRVIDLQEVIFSIRGGTGSRGGGGDPDPPAPTTRGSLNIATSGTGNTRTVTVTASRAGTAAPGISVVLNVNNGARLSRTSGGSPLTSTLTLPATAGDYTLTATTTHPDYTGDSETITVTLPGTLSLELVGSENNGAHTLQVTVRNSVGTQVTTPVTVSLSGAGISRPVTVTGSGNVPIALPTTAATLTASATGYNSGYLTLPARTTTPTTDTPPTPAPTPTPTPVSQPSRINIIGSATRSENTVNQQLDQPLLVEVLDDDGDGVEDVRVIFRVRTGQGRLSQRGNGRAVVAETDSRGYARADYTPISASSTVEAEAKGVTRTVTFTITTGAAPATDTTGTAGSYKAGDKIPGILSRTFSDKITINGQTYTCTSSGECVISNGFVTKGQIEVSGTTPPGTSDTPRTTEISPVVQVNAANRPPMLWVDGGSIYALVGKDVQKFVPSVDNAVNIAVGGNKVYWTEMTSESSGTINSANLDGTGVKELKSIMAVPMGIAVDPAGSKLYWTNSRGRIQSANLDGDPKITNVLQNLPGPMDIALNRGIVYWTQYDAAAGAGSVGIVNPTARGVPKTISTGADSPGSLVIGGGKIYWTAKTGESGGTINSVNLNGTGATQLASILATPVGIAVDAARSKLYWTNARGRIQNANLDGSGIQNIVDGLGSPGELVLSNSLKPPVATTPTSTKSTKTDANYDVDGSGSVDNVDVFLVALAVGTSNAKYDVNGDGTVDDKDIALVRDNRDDSAASAPMIVGMKLSADQIGRLQEQVDLLIATGDRSPATLKTLVYLQQLLATARPEKTQLLANYPNPFNPETWMPYELATDTEVRITIYTSNGVVVRTLQFGHQSAGYYRDRERAAYWDGRNAFGEQVASGIYFYQLETDDMSSLRKMVILK